MTQPEEPRNRSRIAGAFVGRILDRWGLDKPALIFLGIVAAVSIPSYYFLIKNEIEYSVPGGVLVRSVTYDYNFRDRLFSSGKKKHTIEGFDLNSDGRIDVVRDCYTNFLDSSWKRAYTRSDGEEFNWRLGLLNSLTEDSEAK